MARDERTSAAANRPRYRTIVADPPWSQPSGGRHNGSDGRRIRNRPSALPYETLDVAAISALELSADRDAHLYLWTTNAHVEDAYTVARAWGFTPSVLLTWCKPVRGIGLGGTFTQTTEHVLFARRGSLASLQRLPSTWYEWPRREHSAKPEAFLDLVELVSPGPYLEMFARRNRLGWDTWGDEALHGTEAMPA